MFIDRPYGFDRLKRKEVLKSLFVVTSDRKPLAVQSNHHYKRTYFFSYFVPNEVEVVSNTACWASRSRAVDFSFLSFGLPSVTLIYFFAPSFLLLFPRSYIFLVIINCLRFIASISGNDTTATMWQWDCCSILSSISILGNWREMLLWFLEFQVAFFLPLYSIYIVALNFFIQS